MKKIINPWKGMDKYNCFGCCPTNESGVKMEFFEDGDEIISFWKPEPQFQGWINTLHGGIHAVLLDEISGWTVFRKMQTGGVTSKMEIKYLKPVDTTQSHLILKARIKGIVRNLVTVEAELYSADDELCSKALCTYYTFSKEKAEKDMNFRGCDVEPEEFIPLI